MASKFDIENQRKAVTQHLVGSVFLLKTNKQKAVFTQFFYLTFAENMLWFSLRQLLTCFQGRQNLKANTKDCSGKRLSSRQTTFLCWGHKNTVEKLVLKGRASSVILSESSILVLSSSTSMRQHLVCWHLNWFTQTSASFFVISLCMTQTWCKSW